MHFLRKNEVYSRTLGKPRACVKVRVEKDTLVVCEPEDDKPNISVAKTDTQWSEVPDRVTVVGADGKVIKPSKGKKFYVTVETFDPFHLVMEAGDGDWF